MQIITQNNQSLLDIAIQMTGKAENLLKIAVANGISPTSVIAPGTVITIPENVVIDENIFKFYSANNIVPTTALKESEQENIELTFLQKVHKILKG